MPTWVSKRAATIIVCLLVLTYAAFFSFLSIRSMESLEAFGFDLAINDQVMWNTARGEFLITTITSSTGEPTTLLGLNYSFLLVALAPLYWLWDNVRVLLIAQSVVLALGAFPVYWLARAKLGRWIGVAFALVYLLFPPLQAANLFDFHPIALAVPLLALAFWFLLRKHNAGFAVTALLAMHVREQVPIAIAMMALYALIIQRRWKFGASWIAISALIFVFANYFLIPSLNPQQAQPLMNRYGELGSSPLAIMWNAITNPALVWQRLGPARTANYVYDLLYPFGLTSLLAPFELVLMLPDLLINQLSTHTTMNRLAAEYPLTLIPIIALSAVIGTARLTQLLTRKLPLSIARSSIMLLIFAGTFAAQREHGLTPLSISFTDYPASPHTQRIDKVIAQIPQGASVWAQPNLLPLVAHRERLYTWGQSNADYYLIDVATVFNQDNFSGWVQQTLLGDYHIAFADDGFLLLQRGKGKAELPTDWFKFAVVNNPTIQNPVHVVFGDAIELLGYDVRYYEWEINDEPQLFLYLRALRPLGKAYRIQPYLLDDKGQVIGAAEWQQATTVWYPTFKWSPNEIVRVRVNTVTWYTGDKNRFALALGIVDSDDVWDASARIAPRVIDSPYVTVLPADGTLVQLGTFSSDALMRRRFIPQLKMFSVPSDATHAEFLFDDRIALAGYKLETTTEALRVTLYWRANAIVSEKYTVFTQLLDSDGALIAQNDSPPNYGNTPTSVWSPGEIIADEHVIPIAPGSSIQAQLVVGLYDPITGARLRTQTGNDFALLGTTKFSR